MEEAIVRRELSDNFCFYNPSYDRIDGLYPQFNQECWAQVIECVDMLVLHRVNPYRAENLA